MAARRKLDALGVKLSLSQWEQLGRGERLMICHAPTASKEERDALRIFIEEATMARTGLAPKSLPDEACRSADPPVDLPELLERNARAAGIKLDDQAWAAMGAACAAHETWILLVAQRDATVAAPSSAEMYEIGTLGIMVEWLRQPDGTMKTLIEGKKRARVTRYVFDEESFRAEAEEIEEPVGRSAELEGRVDSVVSAFAIYAQSSTRISPEIASSIAAIDDPSILSDKMVRHLGHPTLATASAARICQSG
jgi:Conserved nitrate reductase-associated protein (Nitr_red_assoc)/ATP-dependent protease La (LON) substrate-binding domain